MTFAFFPLKPGSKTPAISGWQHVAPGAYAPVGNYGIPLTPHDLILDADPRKYPDGRDTLADLLNTHQMHQTRVVRTGGGGWHLYFKKPPHVHFRKKQKAYPGIDFLSYGAFVVGPGSVVSGNEYTIYTDNPIAEVPSSLLAVLEERADNSDEGIEVSLTLYNQFKAELETMPPAVDGKGGHDHTYGVGLRGRDLGLPKDVVFRLMRDVWNPHNLGPWTEPDLYKIVCNAYKYAKNAPGNMTPEAKFLAEHDQSANVIQIKTYQGDLVTHGMMPESLRLDKKGDLTKCLANVAYTLRHDAAWAGRLRYNEFSSNLEFTGRPEWRHTQMNEGVAVNKRDFAAIRTWFSSAGHVRLEVAKDMLESALLSVAIPYHPVREYLNGLVWDGIPRLDGILIDTAGAIDTGYTRAVGRCLMLGAVKRIYEPGCKHDYVPVLESVQGEKKSTWVSVLGGEWYSANELNRGDKDTYQNLRGRWFVELPEINATFSKADFNWLKGIITNATDVYRASYGEFSRAVPRESVFVATINPNASREYLKDDENRRYWPICTGHFSIERLSQDRDQYFAEAVARYKAGEPTWIVDPAVQEQARAEQAARKERDPWVEILAPWVEHKAFGFKPVEAYAALGFAGSHVASHHRQRLYGALRDLGFEYRRDFGNGGLWLNAELRKLF